MFHFVRERKKRKKKRNLVPVLKLGGRRGKGDIYRRKFDVFVLGNNDVRAAATT